MKKKILIAAVFLMFAQIGLLQAQQTTNYVTKFGASPPAIINSLIFDNGTYVGIGTASPTKTLSLLGTAAKTIWMERHTTANTAGNQLTVQAGGATSGATNKNGGNLILSSGISTGTGSSNIILGVFPAGSSGTSDNTFTERMRILYNGNIGMGLTTPQAPLHLHSLNQKDDGGGGGGAMSMVGFTELQITNSTTGSNADVGLELNQFGNTSEIKALSGSLNISTTAGFIINGTSNSQVSTNGLLSLNGISGIGLVSTGGDVTARGNSFYFWNPQGAIFKMLNAGNVGIGTITPGSLLQVNGAAAIGYSASTSGPSNGLCVSGNVGLGTTTPGAKLEVAGQVKITGGSPGANKILVSDANGLGTWTALSTLNITTNNCTTVNKLLKMTSSTDMDCSQIYDNGTNVGIGTTSPTAKLEVDGDRLILMENSKTLTLDADSSGKIMIGGSTNVVWFKTGSDYNTIKCGKVWAQTEVKVQNTDPWPDFVLDKDYNLISIPELENYIRIHKHLPNVPSSADVEKDGISLGKMDITLLQKVEELTLYVIDLKKENDALQKANDDLGKRVNALEAKK